MSDPNAPEPDEGEELLTRVHDAFCWREGELPTDARDEEVEHYEVCRLARIVVGDARTAAQHLDQALDLLAAAYLQGLKASALQEQVLVFLRLHGYVTQVPAVVTGPSV